MTPFTALFLHGGVMHIMSNMMCLAAFAPIGTFVIVWRATRRRRSRRLAAAVAPVAKARHCRLSRRR